MTNEIKTHVPDPYNDDYSKTVFGFWVYILTDFILFGVFFATYAVLRKNTFGGPSGQELFHLPFNLAQSLILLTGSFFAGIGGASAHRKNPKTTILYFSLTFLLGVAFVCMVFSEFSRLVHMGSSWRESAFLSMYFTLVGVHSIHVLFGLLWTFIFLSIVFRDGLIPKMIKRLTCLRMFWQFLNFVWIFIFTFVYLMGVN